MQNCKTILKMKSRYVYLQVTLQYYSKHHYKGDEAFFALNLIHSKESCNTRICNRHYFIIFDFSSFVFLSMSDNTVIVMVNKENDSIVYDVR